jgi:hypothetical protein
LGLRNVLGEKALDVFFGMRPLPLTHTSFFSIPSNTFHDQRELGFIPLGLAILLHFVSRLIHLVQF